MNGNTTTIPAADPAGLLAGFARRGALANSLWYQGHLMHVLASGEQTGGTFALIEIDSMMGHEPPRHVHEREDETYYILEGHGTFFVGDEVIEAVAGSVVFLPRGVPHSFKIRSEHASVLLLVTPAGFEDWFREFGGPAEALTLPPAGQPSYADIERMMAAAPRYGITFLPPSAAEMAEAALSK